MNSKVKVAAFLLLLSPVPLLANPVVYTDTQHPPVNLSPGTRIVWLDGPEHLQNSLFGDLPASMEQAASQARTVLQSPDWQRHEQALQVAYRGVMHAWELGVSKYPAVVFDDRDVVYGTLDVAKATALRAKATETGGRP
ncbi:TIGR03757 family integrating conjugative element protein [Dickeya fangzhongdai]|uniref:TIGR03757 family integrating conjugative element protein n=1 Tax=Dickeya fangzhongdai TaxID=1778540 RepID=UPI002B25826A|nr:TIGR03757 family integrating conjugative element protein [Dickeya fangzhongdai]WOY03110.1 TIGR03757 family integrating conjugative element protein [Dickeya fangzhongdai]